MWTQRTHRWIILYILFLCRCCVLFFFFVSFFYFSLLNEMNTNGEHVFYDHRTHTIHDWNKHEINKRKINKIKLNNNDQTSNRNVYVRIRCAHIENRTTNFHSFILFYFIFFGLIFSLLALLAFHFISSVSVRACYLFYVEIKDKKEIVDPFIFRNEILDYKLLFGRMCVCCCDEPFLQ